MSLLYRFCPVCWIYSCCWSTGQRCRWKHSGNRNGSGRNYQYFLFFLLMSVFFFFWAFIYLFINFLQEKQEKNTSKRFSTYFTMACYFVSLLCTRVHLRILGKKKSKSSLLNTLGLHLLWKCKFMEFSQQK